MKFERFHFGAIVVNHGASPSDPRKIGMVGFTDVSDKAAGPSLCLSDGKGNRWRYSGPDEALEIVGSGLPHRELP